MPRSKALSVVLNSASNFSGYAISIVLGLISYPIIIGQIGIEAVGIYALIMAVLAPMDLTNLGFAEATIKYVAQYAEAKDYDKVKQYISTTLFLSIVVGIAGMIIIYLVGPPVAYSLFDFKSETFETINICFSMVALGWLVRQLTTVFLSIPSAFQKFKIVAIGNSISSIVTTSSILTSLYFIKSLVGYALGTLIGAIMSLFIWYMISIINFKSISYSIRFYREVWKSSISYGGWQTAGSVGSLVTNQADKYLLGFYLPASASGVYNVIFQIQQRILSAVWKIAEVMFPLFSASSEKSDSHKFNALIRSNNIITTLGIIVFFPFIVLSFPTLNIWIGEEFARSGYVVMRCLLLVGAFASITVVQSFFLMGNAKVKQVTFITYFTGLCTVIGSVMFIPLFGINGAGYGVLFASITRLVLFYAIMKSFFKGSFIWQEYLVSTLLPLLAGMIVVGFFYYFPILTPPGLTFLLVDLGAIAIFIFILIILVNSIFPRAQRYNQEMMILLREVRQMGFKK